MSMKIFMVLKQNSEFTIIVHAAPNETGHFQWYWMNDPNEGPENNIKGAVHESITLSSDEIVKRYQDKWLACHCRIDGEEFPYNQGCVYLTSDFGEMIRRNRFDEIVLVGQDGNFRDDLRYIPALVLQPAKACLDYSKSVWEREAAMPDKGSCFTNDFDETLAFKNELQNLIPDLNERLHPTELDALIDLVADKTCETLRNKGLLSEESKEVLCR